MFLRHNVLSFSWALLIFILSALPGSQFEDSTYPHADKVLHAILYGVLFLLLLVGMIKQKAFEWIRDKVKLKVFLIVLLYGILLELLQGYVFQGRSIEPLDIAANLVGIGFGFVTFLLIYGTEKYT